MQKIALTIAILSTVAFSALIARVAFDTGHEAVGCSILLLAGAWGGSLLEKLK